MKVNIGLINICIENNITFAFQYNKQLKNMELKQTDANVTKNKLRKRCQKALEFLLSKKSIMPTTSKIINPHSQTAPYYDNRKFNFLFWTRNKFFVQVYNTNSTNVNYYFIDLKQKKCYLIQRGTSIDLDKLPPSAHELRFGDKN
jgi:hypothetical protein